MYWTILILIDQKYSSSPNTIPLRFNILFNTLELCDVKRYLKSMLLNY